MRQRPVRTMVFSLLIFLAAIAGAAALNGISHSPAINVFHPPAATDQVHGTVVTYIVDVLNGPQTVIVQLPASALDVLTAISETHQIDMYTQTYPGMGVLVKQISSYTNGDDEKYWQYMVNDQNATIGADQYQVQDGDVILWEFKSFE